MYLFYTAHFYTNGSQVTMSKRSQDLTALVYRDTQKGVFVSALCLITSFLILACRDYFFCLRVHRGSAIAKIVGANAGKYDHFDTTVNMWVFEEMVDGRKLTEIINTDHENVKYLPGHKLPPNVVSEPRLPSHQHVSCQSARLTDGLLPCGSGGGSRPGRVSEGSRHPDLRGASPVHPEGV